MSFSKMMADAFYDLGSLFSGLFRSKPVQKPDNPFTGYSSGNPGGYGTNNSDWTATMPSEEVAKPEDVAQGSELDELVAVINTPETNLIVPEPELVATNDSETSPSLSYPLLPVVWDQLPSCNSLVFTRDGPYKIGLLKPEGSFNPAFVVLPYYQEHEFPHSDSRNLLDFVKAQGFDSYFVFFTRPSKSRRNITNSAWQFFYLEEYFKFMNTREENFIFMYTGSDTKTSNQVKDFYNTLVRQVRGCNFHTTTLLKNGYPQSFYAYYPWKWKFRSPNRELDCQLTDITERLATKFRTKPKSKGINLR